LEQKTGLSAAKIQKSNQKAGSGAYRNTALRIGATSTAPAMNRNALYPNAEVGSKADQRQYSRPNFMAPVTEKV